MRAPAILPSLVLPLWLLAGCSESPAPHEPQGTSASSAAAAPTKSERCADDGLVAVRVVGQASHADAKSDVRLEMKSKRLHGAGYEIPAGTDDPKATKVDVQVEAADVEAVLELLRGLCLPIETAKEPQHSAPGGYTRWELIYPEETVVLAYGTPVDVGEKFSKITVEQFRALGKVWPKH